MAISDLLTKLTNDISDSYDAVEAKGGTIPEHKNTDNLPTAIESIQGGGGDFPCKTSYGRLWYAPFTESWEIEYSDQCSVTIDQAKFSAYEATNPIQDWGGGQRASFDYNSEEGTWQSWDFETPVDNVTTEQMAEQLGITITLEPGTEWAGFSIEFEATPVVGEWEHLDLDSTDWTNLGNDPYSAIVIGGKTIPRDYVRRFEFGSVPTSIPEGFLANSGLEEIGEIPDNYTGAFTGAFRGTKLNSPVIVSSNITRFELAENQYFNNIITFTPPPAQQQYDIREIIVRTNAKAFAFGKNTNRITIYGLPGFNDSLAFPEGLKTLTLKNADTLNTSFSLPQNLREIDGLLRNCPNFTATVYVGNLSPSIYRGVANEMFSCNSNTAPAYTTGIKIAGANRAAWLEEFPDLAISTAPKYYRHLVDAGY